MSNNPMDTHVGKRLRLRRSMVGMSQEALGNVIGVTFQQVQKYERGINRIGAGRLHDFAKILSVPISYFYEGFPEEGKESGFAEDSQNFEYEKLGSKESLALVRAFHKIQDPVVRRKLLALVKSLSTEYDDDNNKEEAA